MAGAINSQRFLNNDLKLFAHFATLKGGSLNESARVVDSGGKIGGMSLQQSWNVRRSKASEPGKSARDDNNAVRDRLVRALTAEYRVDDLASLPKKVRAALVGRGAVTAEQDFQFNADGKSTSGKPLTRRRITAVLKAVEAEHDEVNKKVLRMGLAFARHAGVIKRAGADRIKEMYERNVRPLLDKAMSTGTLSKADLHFDLDLWLDDTNDAKVLAKLKALEDKVVAILKGKGVNIQE